MRLRNFLRVLAAILSLLLAGCAGTPLLSSNAREVVDLLDYHEKLNAMAADEQRREYQAAQAAFERQSGDMQRLRLALLLTLPRVSWRDDARALQLLGGLDAVPADRPSPKRDLALLIQKLVGERQRQLRDEQRKVEDLQQKLDALRAIDREIRQKPPRR
jgi:hypothetical protein